MLADIAQRGETAEGRRQRRPGGRAEVAAQDLRVLDDRVGPEAGERLGDGGGVLTDGFETGDGTGRRADRVRPTGPALIEHDDLEVRERTREPGVGAHRSDRARGLDNRPALQEDEVGLVAVRRGGDDASEQAGRMRHAHLRTRAPTDVSRQVYIPALQSLAGPVRLLHAAHRGAARAVSRFSEESLPRISLDSNSGGETLRPDTASRSSP